MSQGSEDSVERLQTERQRGGAKPPPNFVGRIGSPEVHFVCCYCAKRLRKPEPVYPHLNASVCSDCVGLNPALRFSEQNVTNRVFAPWSEKELASLASYQQSDLLPYICTKGHVLEVRAGGFNCRFCASFSLLWAYDWSLKYGWN